jgi:hypothetical protein
MGVYACVHVCIDRVEPLPVETRVAVVELAMKHALITKNCKVHVVAPVPVRGIVGAIRSLFGARRMEERTIEEGAPGPWLAERIRTLEPEFSVSSGFPMWKGESLTGPFIYTCYREPEAITAVNAYRDEPNPYAPADGVIGQFFDAMEINAKRGCDARSVASSLFVKELKTLTGAKIVCRTSWT